MKKITQKKAVFYVLYQAFQEDPEQYVPAWRFVGELHIKELHKWFLMSYKCPANGVNLYFENPNLIEMRQTVGKSGAKYYEYRIRQGVQQADILDKNIFEFYREIKRNKI